MMKKKMPSSMRMEEMPAGIAPLPEEHGETDMSVQDMFDGGGKIQLNVSDYPELTGIEPGAPVSGKWEGNADNTPDEDGNVMVTFSTMEIETENKADRELAEMTGKPEQTGGNEGEEDDEI